MDPTEHPDYQLILEVLGMMNSGEEQPDDPHFLAVVESVLDEEVMAAAANRRVEMYMRFPPPSAAVFKPWLMAIWCDAFTNGALFERSRRTRDGTTQER